MSMKPEPIGPIPPETERVARAAFPKGNRAMQVRDRLGGIYDDTRFAGLFAGRVHTGGDELYALPRFEKRVLFDDFENNCAAFAQLTRRLGQLERWSAWGRC